MHQWMRAHPDLCDRIPIRRFCGTDRPHQWMRAHPDLCDRIQRDARASID
jgi:hypothetical protein